MSSLRPGAQAEPVLPADTAMTPLTSRSHGLDLRPFEELLPLLMADVEAVYGHGCRLAPATVSERLYSYLLRVGVVPDGETAPRAHLFVKVYKFKMVDGVPSGLRARVEKDFRVTQRVFERMAGGGRYSAVRPVACHPAHLAIVTEEVPGETLLKVVEQQIRWAFAPSSSADLTNVLASAGAWIRDFQEPAEGAFSLQWIRDYVDSRLQRIAKVHGRRGDRLREDVLRHIDRLGSRLPGEPAAAVMVHADLSPSNILVCGNRVAVIDFAMARPGHPLQDVARLFTQLDLLALKPQYRHAAIRTLQHALLRGFDPALRLNDPAFRLQVLAQRVNHLGSLSTKKYDILERTFNRFIVWQHWRWIEREIHRGDPEAETAWG